MPTSPLTILVVAHTHWDREWYHSAERFRQRLIPLVDELLDAPPPAGASFLLDGQGIVLEDYLAVRPERAAELSALLRDGRIEAGPWYVLADELIPSGEALLRNLLEGRDAVRRLRGEPPPVLYCPDSFGHPAILPELASGFGCELVVLWRGYGGARWPAGDTVRWRGPTGTSVLVHHLPRDGYEFGSSLPTSREEADSRWQHIDATLRPRATTGMVLLLNGADHHARQRDQAHAVTVLASSASNATVSPSSLAGAVQQIVEASATKELPIIAGELRDSYGYTWTLGGTLATRAAQKRRNAIVERTLVRDVEPWIALTTQGGDTGRRALLRAAWRDLLRGHPHDTLCGTSIDAVADAFDQSLATVHAQADGLRSDALRALVEHDAELARFAQPDWRPALLLRNPVARRRVGVAEVVITEKVADVAVGPGSASRQGARTALEDSLLGRLGLQQLAVREVVELTESPRAYPDADLVRETRALMWVDGVAGYTAVSRPLDEIAATAPPGVVVVGREAMDNGILRVSVDASGIVRVEDHGSGRVITDLLRLERERDAGDLYTPAIRERQDVIRFLACERTLSGPLRGELALRFDDAGAGGAIEVRLQLESGLAAVRIRLSGVNRVTNGRLRLGVRGDLDRAARTGVAPEGADVRANGDGGDGEGAHSEFGGAPHAGHTISTLADAAFHPVLRRPTVATAEDAQMEHVVHTAPLHRFVSRFARDRGMTLISDGLAEYESLPDGSLAVTLVRSVGELSRHDLPERPGHAGWPAATPGAQCIGPWAAELAVALHGPDTPAQRDTIERLAEDVLLPITGETLRSNLRDARVAGGLELHGDGLAFSAAMPARQPGWIVLRCVNRRDEGVQGTWRLDQPILEVRRARLDETPSDSLEVDGNVIRFRAAPMEIVTILVLPGNSGGREAAGR